MARISLSELRTRASTVDQARLDAATDAEILAERSADPDAPSEMPADIHTVEPPKALRVRLGMTQPEMAAALGIPVGTWRNWEQGRVRLDPTASALLRIVSHDPATALAALAPSAPAPMPALAPHPELEELPHPAFAELSRRLVKLAGISSVDEISHISWAVPQALRAAAVADELLQLVTERKPTRHG